MQPRAAPRRVTVAVASRHVLGSIDAQSTAPHMSGSAQRLPLQCCTETVSCPAAPAAAAGMLPLHFDTASLDRMPRAYGPNQNGTARSQVQAKRLTCLSPQVVECATECLFMRRGGGREHVPLCFARSRVSREYEQRRGFSPDKRFEEQGVVR